MIPEGARRLRGRNHGASLLRRLPRYAWAAPNTLLGLFLGTGMLAAGGRLRFVAGTAEVSLGPAARLLERLPRRYRFGAMTLGHVILGLTPETLTALRAHERAHVRQYEFWGPAFLPAYALSSLWQLLRGRRAHRDNWFERQACAREIPH